MNTDAMLNQQGGTPQAQLNQQGGTREPQAQLQNSADRTGPGYTAAGLLQDFNRRIGVFGASGSIGGH